ncbi:MAG: toprim domain-containing protein [Phenylobacterium sp.]|nr:toprim domain-containing protein [Phenylobacterium sp.]
MSAAADVAKRLHGTPLPQGGWLCRCPLPGHGKGHGDRRPSLSVTEGEHAILLHCFAGCDTRDILDHLRRAGILDDRDAAPRSRPSLARPTPPDHVPDPVAVGLWHEARPIAGSVAETYLRGRGISVPLPPSLRVGTRLHLGRIPVPALVAAIQAPNREVIAVQSTMLTWEARKAPAVHPRINTGAMGFGAVRLAAAGEILGLAEGVETALSAMQLAGVPVWAALGAQRLARVAIPREVAEVHIFADNDDPGRAQAEQAADRHAREGRSVRIRFPALEFADWNDALRALEVAA